MEPAKRFFIKLDELRRALSSFGKLMDLNLELLPDEDTRDIYRNARIQKFEITLELLWKTIKVFVLWKEGADVIYSKDAFKKFLLGDYISEANYEVLADAIDDRNLLSHEYREGKFREVHDKLQEYLLAMISAYDVLFNHSNQ